jgi:hypothetical protein
VARVVSRKVGDYFFPELLVKTEQALKFQRQIVAVSTILIELEA